MNESDEKLRQLIAENIAYYRKLNGDTQAGLAEKLSYSDKSVSKWERGDGTPDIFISPYRLALRHHRAGPAARKEGRQNAHAPPAHLAAVRRPCLARDDGVILRRADLLDL